MARSMLSLGMFAARAAAIAERRRGLVLGSGNPDLAAALNSRISLVKSLRRGASCAPLRYMMFLNCECPAMSSQFLDADAMWTHIYHILRKNEEITRIDRPPVWRELGALAPVNSSHG